jgi:hypothetical protein
MCLVNALAALSDPACAATSRRYDLRSHLDDLPCARIRLAPKAIRHHHNGVLIEHNGLAIHLCTGKGFAYRHYLDSRNHFLAMAASVNPKPAVASSISDHENKPWKYIGYRTFTSFIASDNDFFILRRFSTLAVRVLLVLQDELSELEDQLAIIDARLSDPLAPDVHNGSFRQETSELRLELIREIDQKLRSYSEFHPSSHPRNGY